MNNPPAKQTVSTWAAAALVVSNMIGTGVFMSLGWQVAGFTRADGTSMLSGSVFPFILLWVTGGVLALCGALCYAELATALPRSGGEYNFLSRIYHPVVGFCTGLSSASIGFAAPVAVSALVFGDYLCRAFPSLLELGPHDRIVQILAIVLVTAATLCHLRSLRFSGVFQSAVTGLTVLLILAFICAGFSAPKVASFAPHAADLNPSVLGTFGNCLIYVMFAYSGWNAAAYIIEEVRDPAKALPRALILGAGFVIFLYVALNAVFLYSTPLADFALKPEVAHIAGTSIFGPAGARLASGLICIGLIAHVSAMMWVGSRVNEAIGTTYPVLGILGRTSKTQVPYVSLLYQSGVIFLFLLLFNDPGKIARYVESVLGFWCLLTVVGVIVLRFREPELARPYRAWGYPFTPIIFAVVTIFCLIETYESHPRETVTGAALVLIGIPIWYWASREVPEDQLRGVTLPESST